MNKDYVRDIVPAEYKSRGSYTPAKVIDMGQFYQIYVSGLVAFCGYFQQPRDFITSS